MEFLHSWDVSIEEAFQIQKDLSGRVVLKNRLSEVKTVAGSDVAYARGGTFLFGAMVVLSYPGLKPLDWVLASGKVTFPYLPGLFSFREGPVLVKVFNRLKVKPDLILFDGHGIAHPRRFGLASHMGLWFDLPSVGCARTSLLKDFTSPESSQGSFAWVYLKGERVGAALRTRQGVKPVFVSPGHRIDLRTSIHFILSMCRQYRIPEPLRLAHQLSRSLEIHD